MLIPLEDHGAVVARYWLAQSGWDIGALQEFLAREVIKLLKYVVLANEQDVLRCRLVGSGLFSSARAYEVLADVPVVDSLVQQRIVWKFRGP